MNLKKIARVVHAPLIMYFLLQHKYFFNRVIIVLSLVWLLMPKIPIHAAPLIIDHTAVELYDDIPQYYIDEVKKMHLNYPGESHGRGLPNGLLLLEQQDSKYTVEVTWTGQPEAPTDQHFRVSKTFWTGASWSMYGGEEDTYTNQAAIDTMNNHFAYVNDTLNNNIDAYAFGWCWDMTWHNGPGGGIDPVYQVRWAGSSVDGPEGDLRWGLDDEDTTLTGNSVNMQDYLDALTYYGQNNPDTTMIYTTGPVDSSGESGYQRYLKHEAIRNWVRSSENRVLFDYGDILCYSGAGERYTTSWTDYGGTGHTYPREHPENDGESDPFGFGSGHLSNEGYLKLGKAMWVFMARLAGWDGVTDDGYILNISVDGSGQVTKIPDQATYNPGDTVTLEALPDLGYVFASWSGDLTGNTNPIDIIMDSNKFVTANFAPESAQAPSAVISANPTSGEAPLAVNFDGSSSSDPDGEIEKYEWDFENDGVVDGQGVTTSYTYNTVGTYTARLTVTDSQGLSDIATTIITVSAKTPDTSLFDDWKLDCYNNVFNPLKGEEAIVEVTLKEQGMVSVVLYNTRGQEIKKLVDKEEQPETYRYYWDGKNDSGNVVSSGLYFVHIQAGDFKKTKKIVVVK